MSRGRLHPAIVAGTVLCAAGAAYAQPDVIVGSLPSVQSYTPIGGINAYAVGTTSCNIGDQVLNWIDNSNQHPVITQNVFRLANGRFEQLGQGWMKHGFCALSGTLCGPCQATGCSTLGVGCSDPYSASLNGSQGGLGPKSDVNPVTGFFNWPFTDRNVTGNSIFKRIQVNAADLATPGALYFVSSHYVTPDEPPFGMDMNNEAYRRVTVSGGNLNTTGSTQQQKYAIEAWKDNDPSVTQTLVDVPGDGRFIVAMKATDNGNGTWHYEYAIQNYNSDRAAGGFLIPISNGLAISNLFFKDVDYHSGYAYSNTDWSAMSTASQVQFRTTQTHAQNPNSNALRWDTIYNFAFDAASGPVAGNATLELFKPGSPSTISFSTFVPGDGSPTPPLNDDCANAFVVTAGSTPFSNANATTDGPDEPGLCLGSGDSNVSADVWFSYTAPCDGDALLSLCGSGFDTKMAVYNGCPGSGGSILACNDDSCGLQSEITFGATGGETYLIRVGGYNGATGSGTLSITDPNCPSDPTGEDACADATPISGDGVFNFDNSSATTDGSSDPLCNAFGSSQIDNDVWFRWTAGASGDVTVSFCGQTGVDTKVAAYNGASCPSGSGILACNDDTCGLQSQIQFSATAGNVYLLRVGTFPGATGGTGAFTITTTGGPVNNDACADAEAISGDGTFAFDNSSATMDGVDDPACLAFSTDSIDNDVWFAWTADVTGDAVLDTCGETGVDTRIAVYAGTNCPSGSGILDCNDDTCALQSQVEWAVTAGSSYLIRVGTFPGAAGGTGTFTIATTPVITGPANDDCFNAIGVADPGLAFDTTGATTDGPAHPECDAFGDDQVGSDIWFNYPAQVTGTLTISTCNGAAYDTKIAVYEGTGCDNLATRIMACNDDFAGCSNNTSELTISIVQGTSYTIRVGGYNGATGTGFLSLTAVEDVSDCRQDQDCPPNVDEMGGVDSGDFFTFIPAFLSGDVNDPAADYNCDNGVDSGDFFDFIGDFINAGSIPGC